MPRCDISDQFICPLGLDIINEPVIIIAISNTGEYKSIQGFDKQSVDDWVNHQKRSNSPLVHPMTREKLLLDQRGNLMVINDIGFRPVLEDFKKKKLSTRNDFFEAIRNNKLQDLIYNVWYTPDDLKALDPTTGLTALQHAISNRNIELIKHFLVENKDLKLLENKDRQGNTAFYTAIATNDLAIVGIVLRETENKNQLESFELLYDFCDKNKLNFIDFLREQGFNIHQLKSKESSLPLLHFLLRKQNNSEAERLLKEGYDVNIKNTQGKTALDCYCESESKNTKVMDLLLQHSANISDYTLLFMSYPDINIALFPKVDWIKLDNKNKSSFQSACEVRNINTMKVLLSHKVKIQSFQLLWDVCKRTNTNIIELIKDVNLLNVLPTLKDSSSLSLLEVAYIKRDKKLVRALLNQTQFKPYTVETLKALRHINATDISKMSETITELEKIQERDKKVLDEIVHPKMEELKKATTAPERISILFKQYESPSFFSAGYFNSRTALTKKTAGNFVNTLDAKKNATWNSARSKLYISTDTELRRYLSTQSTINKFGTFKGLLSFIKKTDFDKPLFSNESSGTTPSKKI
jgi:ankyrin repeat protein